jgi:ectoine hydroxylase-related dioxygenase (phytanoyl-CoA dioxygenase family)
MRRGDILLFNAKTIHAATVQRNRRTRLSLDTRITSCPRRKE